MSITDLLTTVPPRTILCDHCADEVTSAYEKALCPTCYEAWQRDLAHADRVRREREEELHCELLRQCREAANEDYIRERETEFLREVNSPVWYQVIERRRQKRAEKARKGSGRPVQAF